MNLHVFFFFDIEILSLVDSFLLFYNLQREYFLPLLLVLRTSLSSGVKEQVGF